MNPIIETRSCKEDRNLYVDRLRGLDSLAVVLSHASGYIQFMFYGLPQRLLVSVAVNAYHAVFRYFGVSDYDENFVRSNQKLRDLQFERWASFLWSGRR
jgi:hypothetical protein